MKKKLALTALTAVGVLVALASVADDSGTAKSSSTRPPQNLKKVGDHWTPWEPPAASPDDYIIQKGDTLWGLGQQWLGNPYLWPQIWDQNRYVQDSHWIYPGDPIVRPGKPQVVPPEGPPPSNVGNETAPAEPPPTSGGGFPESTSAPAPMRPLHKVLPLASDHDVYCSGYIDPDHTYAQLWVAGREMEKNGVATGDVIFLNHGSNQGVEAGMDLEVIRQTWKVKHPATKKEMGHMIQRLGKVRVLCAYPESAVGVILDSCDAIFDSDELVPWRDIPVPAVSSMPPFDRYCKAPEGIAGYVVAIKDEVEAAGTGQIIHADLGETSGLQPGQFLSIYRDNEEPLPRRMIGQAMILTIEPGSCTAKVTMSVRELVPGDRVEAIQ